MKKQLKNWFSRNQLYLFIINIIVFIVLNRHFNFYSFIYISITTSLMILNFKSLKYIILLTVIFVVFFLYFSQSFTNDNILDSNFKVIEVKKNYSILGYHNKFYYMKTNIDSELKIGEHIKVEGEFKKINISHNYWDFNFENYLKNKNVLTEIKQKNYHVIYHDFFRYNFYSWIEKQNKLVKIFIGNIKDKDLNDSLSELSLTFVLNISSMHIILISNILKKYVWKNNIYCNSIRTLLYSFLFFYIWLLNFPIILLKTFLIILFNFIFIRNRVMFTKKISFCLIWYIELLINPFYIFNIGFIYITIAFIFIKKIDDYSFKKNLIINFILINLIFIPIQAYYDYKFFWIAEIQQLILFPIIIFSYLYTIILLPFTTFPNLFEWLYNFILGTSNLMGKYNVTTLVGNFSQIWLWTYYIVLFFSLKIDINNKKIAYFLYSLISFNMIGMIVENKMPSSNYIEMLNVSNGNSYFAKINNKNLFFDTGGGYGVPENTLFNFLKYNGISKIDYTFISHNHLDHYGLLAEAKKIANFAKIFYWNDYFKEVTILNNIKIKNFQITNRVDENENSKVLYFEVDNKRILFTGDITKYNEKWLLSNNEFITTINNGIDYYQVPHHGSNTSTSFEFIKAIKPKNCFISSKNMKGRPFPSKETVQTLNENNCKTYITDGMNSYKYYIKTGIVQKE